MADAKSNVDSKIVKLELNASVVDWGKLIILHWEHSVAATTSDWIGLYKKGEPSNQQYITWEYITVDSVGKSGAMGFDSHLIFRIEILQCAVFLW